ncbi:phosphoribosyltransferase [symbiont of Argiope bruennichi]|uniref:phosphoribosyltransferase n=1 Tax=symbiont of Argiope bruennichi TaxID=2810479 RepID=UPI003DA5487C
MKFFSKIKFSTFDFYFLNFYKGQNRQNVKVAKSNKIFSPLLNEAKNSFLPIFFKKNYWVLLPPTKTPDLLLNIGRILGFNKFLFLFSKKNDRHKQSYKKDKSEIFNQIFLDKITNINFFQNKKIVIFDDVMTSGWTIKTLIIYLKKNYILSKIKCIKIVVLYKTISNDLHKNYISKEFLFSEE